MSHAIVPAVLVALCLAAAFLVSWDLAPLVIKPRPRRPGSLRADLDDLNAAYRQSLSQRDPSPLLACRDLMLRERRPAVTANPEGPAPAPASGAGPADTPERFARAMHKALHGLDDVAPTRTDLPIPPPRNGVRLQDRPRQTVDVIICDPAVTPVVPRWYQAWLEGRFTP